MNRRILGCLIALSLVAAVPSSEARGKKKSAETPKPDPQVEVLEKAVAGLSFREIGPALTSGRITDLAIDPTDHRRWYVATASGGVWLTENAATTWQPIFDHEGSYSIGCITMDPNNPHVLWVGSGENNSQRSVAWGDGVYKSIDGGKSWKNMGLGESEHIGRIVVDPRDSNVVYVASQGPLWRAGGDRGLYKTTDGGESWELVLEISENTGVNEVWMDPRDPDVLIASSYQRRRRTWTLINGGPESGIWRSTDAGASWTEIESGLPKEDMGRIGLAISPANPDVVYAIVESIDDAGGVFRSTDGGVSWKKRSSYMSSSPQYYNELVADPHDADRVYSMDTWMHVSEDGGASFHKVPERAKHVDNHALWIDPGSPDHIVAGCDGGIYETWDRGENWRFVDNLPLTQFYKIAADNALPFYNVYGGTQDNSTLGGPSRTTSEHGISNRDWFVTLGGDGFKPGVDPENPDIVYSQWQHGNLWRLDRASGEKLSIQPQTEPDEDPARWNWDSAFLISPHQSRRLYFASQRVYRSDDRGDSWRPVSPDLTRNIDRNRLEVMGRVWGVDTVSKNRSTSFFGTVVSLTESPRVEGLLYAGTDDGVVQVSEDGGESWREIREFPGVPDMAYVSDLEASWHDDDTAFAVIENHKSGDFLPYVLKTTDRGATWTSISSDLPESGIAYTIAEDPVVPGLLFVGTEFGVHVTRDGGKHWVEMGSGLPTIAVRDLVIQARESDLVVGTFGRGIFVLDDYSPLRQLDLSAGEEQVASQLFTPRRTWMYNKSFELGYRGKAFLGASFYAASNPELGALITYHLGEGLETLKEKRRASEAEAREAGEGNPYPSWEELRLEDRAEDPRVVLTIRDMEGAVVRRLDGPTGAGLHRLTWDLRYATGEPTRLEPPPVGPFTADPIGPMVVPGNYTVEMANWAEGEWSEASEPVAFEVAPVGTVTLPTDDRVALLAFQQKTGRLERAALGAARALGEIDERIKYLRHAVLNTHAGDPMWFDRLEGLESRVEDLETVLFGDATVGRRYEPTQPSVLSRIGSVTGGHWTTSSSPTATHRRAYEIAAEQFGPALEGLRALRTDLETLESEMESAGTPWTPGRLPTWSPE